MRIHRTATFTYRRVRGLQIRLDVLRPADQRLRPVAVWIHGGALINGGRKKVGPAGDLLLAAGYCLVSIDYRLAPETKLPDIVVDLEEAFQWIHKNARDKFHGDTTKFAVLGGSAGGHLALTAGFRLKPRPDVLVSFWGYGDLIGPWMLEPSPHARHHKKIITEAEAASISAGPPVANAGERVGDGRGFYEYCRRRAVWPKMVVGFDPASEPERYDPYMASRNVTREYPPTLLIHGAEDTDVPHEQSEIMAREFEKYGVAYRFISVEGAEHGLSGADPADIDAAYSAVLPFIAPYVPPPDERPWSA